MDAYQTIWMICLIPVLGIYSVNEILRGWKILKHGDASLNFVYRTRVWILRQFKGNEAATDYQNSVLANKNEMKSSGVYSVVGGIIMLVLCVLDIHINQGF
jgi:hypothetical protein